jgi:hypothetical protein
MKDVEDVEDVFVILDARADDAVMGKQGFFDCVKKVKMTETKLKTNAKIEGDCFSC